MSRFADVSFWQGRALRAAVFTAAGLVLLGWLAYAPAGLLGKADAVGYAVCHRIEVRSFHLGGRPVSLCARCTGMYLGAMLGLVFQWVRAPRRGSNPPRRVIALLGLVTLAFGIDGLNSMSNLIPDFPSLYTTTNPLRIFLGTGFGVVMAAAVYPAFSQTMWADWRAEPALGSLREAGLLLALAAGLAALVLTENPLLLYPLTLLSAAGVLVVLTMLYAMMAMIVLKAENIYLRWRELATPLAVGFTVAVLQILGADVVRYLIFGTWEGFHIG
jgi:uncharacterized membrane protein